MLNDIQFKFLSEQQMRWVQSRAKTIFEDLKEEEKWCNLHKQHEEPTSSETTYPRTVKFDAAIQVTKVPKKNYKSPIIKEPVKKTEIILPMLNVIKTKIDKLEDDFVRFKCNKDQYKTHPSFDFETVPKSVTFNQELGIDKSQFFQQVLCQTLRKNQREVFINNQTTKPKTVTFLTHTNRQNLTSKPSHIKPKPCLKGAVKTKKDTVTKSLPAVKEPKTKIKSRITSKKTEIPEDKLIDLNQLETKNSIMERISEIQDVENAVKHRLNVLKKTFETSTDQREDLNVPELETIPITHDNQKVVKTKSTDLSLEPDTLYNIRRYRKLFHKYLQKNAHKEVDNFNPWTMANRISDYIVDDCINEVAHELDKIPSSFIIELYEQEFIQEPQL